MTATVAVTAATRPPLLSQEKKVIQMTTTYAHTPRLTLWDVLCILVTGQPSRH